MEAARRLPLPEAEKLIGSIREKGARLSIPGVVDLTDFVEDTDGVTRIVLEGVQDMLLRLALQTARDDYEDRRRGHCCAAGMTRKIRTVKGSSVYTVIKFARTTISRVPSTRPGR